MDAEDEHELIGVQTTNLLGIGDLGRPKRQPPSRLESPQAS